MRIKPAGKAIILLLVLGVAVGGFRLWKHFAPTGPDTNSVVPQHADLPNKGDDSGTPTADNGAPVTLPGSAPGCTDKPEVRLLGYAWNAQMGLLLAIGGPQATDGSQMCKHGVNLKFIRQDDNGKMQEALTAFATALKGGDPNPKAGAHFVTIMGDGSAAFLKGLNDVLKRLGPEYTAKVVASCGFSRGEDKFMGPAEWKANPIASRGGVCAGVLRDGDWNIAQKWLGDNGLRTNPDEKTYDPDALNWVNANDYLDAGEKYIAGYSEDRPVVHNGKRTGETKHITVDSVVTWTPGDVNVAKKKGGLVPIVSTKQYSSQMPCVVIGINKWMKDNRQIVESMIQAIGEAGDEVKSSAAALHHAAEISAAVYNDKGSDAAYWERYYRGVDEPDKNGQTVSLGGSTVSNLADMELTFGLVHGSSNLYAATYRVFGDIVVAQYPTLVPNYPPLSDILDTSYLSAVVGHVQPGITQAALKTVKPTFDPNKNLKAVVSRKAWSIHFNPGKATILPESQAALESMMRDLLVASGAVVEVHGHTDGQGNPATSQPLSEARAFAVKNWLEKRSPVNFPPGRIRVFAHGQQQPIAPNDTAEGRAKNRRVEIVIGTTGA